MVSLLDLLGVSGSGLLGTGVDPGASGYNMQGTPELPLWKQLLREQQGAINPIDSLMRLSAGIKNAGPPPQMAGQPAVRQDPFNMVMPSGPNTPQPVPQWPDNPLSPPQRPAGAQSVSLPTPGPAPSQPQPPAPRPQLPPQAMGMAGAPGIGDRLNAGLMGFANSAGPVAGVANLLSGVLTGQRSDPAGFAMHNQMLGARAMQQTLLQRGFSPQEATTMAIASATNPEVARVIMPQLFGETKMKLGEMEFTLRPGPGGVMQPVLPGGGTINSVEGFVKHAQDIKAAGIQSSAAAAETGKSQGQAKVNLNDRTALIDSALDDVKDLETHPGKNWATGPLAGAAPAIGGQQAAFVAKLNELKAKVKQQQILGGASPADADNYQKSVADLERRGGIDQALQNLREELIRARTQAGVKAGGAATPPPAVKTPYGTVTQVQ